MRNLKKTNAKGFTLVELIVVMAIIGVLAAILVPTMLGFMRDAKVTQANANAKTAYNAASAVLTKECIDNPALTPDYKITLAAGADLSTITVGTGTYDFTEYLGTFKGEAQATVGANGTSISVVTWIDTVAGTHPTDFTKGTQQTQAKAGNVYGVYPLAS